jgi:GNAT superfamily N-acetyltransferase
MKLLRATRTDAARLTFIAHAAKRHWRYPEPWIQQWRPALTVTADYIDDHPTMMAMEHDESVGFCAVVIKRDGALLDHLWVLPAAMGRGLGRTLFTAAEEIARRAGALHLTIVGDPHAEGFYLRMGALRCREEPAPMDGVHRFLPVMEKHLR